MSEKYKHKNGLSLELMKVFAPTISKKNLAVGSKPIVTGNGSNRTVNLSDGPNFKTLIKVSTIRGEPYQGFFRSLKSVGVSSFLLEE